MDHTNVHDLPDDLRVIVQGVHLSSRRFGRLDLVRRFGGKTINRLLESGHLTEAIAGTHLFISIGPLAKREIDQPPPWKAHEIKLLKQAWPLGESISDISTTLGRSQGDVFAKALELDLRRRDGRKWREFSQSAPAWKIKRLRVAIIEAERRGLNPHDDGDGLTHKALLYRFLKARILSATQPSGKPVRWTIEQLSTLRGVRDEGRSIARISGMMKRKKADVARQLAIEGLAGGGGWLPAEDEAIIEGVKDGLSFKKIAKRLPGRRTVDVRSRARTLSRKFSSRRPWTEFEIRSLLEGAAEGLRGEKLTRRVPTRSHHAVRRRFYKLTREPRTHEPWCEAEFHILMMAMRRNEKPTEIAKWVGRPLDEIRDRLADFTQRRQGRHSIFTPEQSTKALRLMAERKITVQEIAAQFGVSRAAVYRLEARAGAKKRRRKKKPRRLGRG